MSSHWEYYVGVTVAPGADTQYRRGYVVAPTITAAVNQVLAEHDQHGNVATIEVEVVA